jgi:Arc/MetJ-type ribon-helix-helix transcriptional regulator
MTKPPAQNTTDGAKSRAQRIKRLQDALRAGERSGKPRPFDGRTFLKRMHD